MNAFSKILNTERTKTNNKLGFKLVALAEEQVTQTTEVEPKQQPTVNFEDLIARARADEKAKLYPKIQKLEDEKKSLVEKNNQLLLSVGEKDTEISRLSSELKKATSDNGKSENEEIKTLKAEKDALAQQLADLQANTVDAEELRQTIQAEIKAEYDVKLYKEQKLRELGDNLIPELVMGNTKEEIDASLEVAQNRFKEITSRFAQPNVASIPPVNVSTSSFNMKDVSPQDISRMTPTEYAEFRKKLGLK